MNVDQNPVAVRLRDFTGRNDERVHSADDRRLDRDAHFVPQRGKGLQRADRPRPDEIFPLLRRPRMGVPDRRQRCADHGLHRGTCSTRHRQRACRNLREFSSALTAPAASAAAMTTRQISRVDFTI